MQPNRTSQIAVIFTSHRTEQDAQGYAAAAEAMETLAAQQEGYCGLDSARDGDGFGVTVSYWQDEASAKAWKQVMEHAVVQNFGRKRWYESYSVHVSRIERSYGWSRNG
jgi:heme-degrading monooxygenase HmoA